MLTCPWEGHSSHHLPLAQNGQGDLEPPLQTTLLWKLHFFLASVRPRTQKTGLKGKDTPQGTKLRLNSCNEAGLRMLRAGAMGVIKKVFELLHQMHIIIEKLPWVPVLRGH